MDKQDKQNKQDKQDKQLNEVKTQSIGAIVGFVAIEVAKSMIGFVALRFFKPVWDRLIKWWKV